MRKATPPYKMYDPLDYWVFVAIVLAIFGIFISLYAAICT